MKYRFGFDKMPDMYWAQVSIMASSTLYIVVVILFLFIIASNLQRATMVGDGKQNVCGTSYMEAETARFGAYNYYTQKEVDKRLYNITDMLLLPLYYTIYMLLWILMGVALFMRVKNKTNRDWKDFALCAGAVGVASVLSFIVSNQRNSAVEKKYTESNIDPNQTGLQIMYIAISLCIMLIGIVVVHTQVEFGGVEVLDKTGAIFLAILAIVVAKMLLVANIFRRRFALLLNDNVENAYGYTVRSFINVLSKKDEKYYLDNANQILKPPYKLLGSLANDERFKYVKYDQVPPEITKSKKLWNDFIDYKYNLDILTPGIRKNANNLMNLMLIVVIILCFVPVYMLIMFIRNTGLGNPLWALVVLLVLVLLFSSMAFWLSGGLFS